MERRAILVPATLALAFPAFAQDLRYNFDASADFSKYKTYKLVVAKNSQPLDDPVRKQLEQAITQALAKTGLNSVESDSPDLYVAYHVAVSTEKQLDAWSDGWGYGPGWRSGWMGGGTTMTQATTSTLYVGELALDMYETPKKQLVWRAVASKTIDTKAKPEKREKNLHKALEKMLSKYPPKK